MNINYKNSSIFSKQKYLSVYDERDELSENIRLFEFRDYQFERNLLGCQRKYLRECQSALKTMNLGRPGLKQCTCDSRPSRSIDDLTRCNLLRRNLNKHPCLAEPPIFLREPQPSVNFRYDRKNEGKCECYNLKFL
ncbi:unnamed protein product [Trichobilharzia regenti]|nr:unnamed protein product [Trichobilharzia regenti]